MYMDVLIAGGVLTREGDISGLKDLKDLKDRAMGPWKTMGRSGSTELLSHSS